VASSNAQLAEILEVSAPAVARVEKKGIIAREPSGTWSVLDVVRAWRASVRPSLQRDPSPWVDPGEELNTTALIRRTRYAGGRVEVQDDSHGPWHEVADPVQRLNAGETFADEGAVDYFALSELSGLVPGSAYWVGVPEMTAGIVAKLTAADQETARVALAGAVHLALLWLIAIKEEELLGPPEAAQLRHGRIPLSKLVPAA
jgi:hypothetical protein